MDRTYHPSENVKMQGTATQVRANTKDTDCAMPNVRAGISEYEERELRKYCLGFATERFSGGDVPVAITIAENLFQWIKTGKIA